MGRVLERLGYWVDELSQEVKRREAEEERSWTEPERGTYREPPMMDDPSWGPSEPVVPPYDPSLPDDPDTWMPRSIEEWLHGGADDEALGARDDLNRRGHCRSSEPSR